MIPEFFNHRILGRQSSGIPGMDPREEDSQTAVGAILSNGWHLTVY